MSVPLPKLLRLSLLVALAGVLHYVEGMLPLPLPVPGFKLGLANVITLYVVATYGLKDAVLVAFSRVALGSLLAGVLFSPTFFMAMAGALAACAVMYGACRLLGRWFSLAGISVMGAVTHNLAQLLVAALLIGNLDLFYYLPYLVLLAVPTGTGTGLAVMYLRPHIPDTFTFS